jgi:hypothetical protein
MVPIQEVLSSFGENLKTPISLHDAALTVSIHDVQHDIKK